VRTSHILRVRVASGTEFAALVRPAFDEHLEQATLLRVESVQGGMLTEATYAVRLRSDAAAQQLVSDLQQATGNNRVVLVAVGNDLGE
jgi:hypothetical protein